MDCEFVDSDDMLVDAQIRGVLVKKVQERLLDCSQELVLNKALSIGMST